MRSLVVIITYESISSWYKDCFLVVRKGETSMIFWEPRTEAEKKLFELNAGEEEAFEDRDED